MAKLGGGKPGLWFVALAAVGLICLYWFSYRGKGMPAPSGPPTFTGDSAKLQQTKIVATLDAPLGKGKNVIWCASFPAAWKVLQNDLAKAPVSLGGNGDEVDALNRAPSPASDVPPGSLYAIAGWENKGIIQQITADLKKQFPDKAPPTFPGILPGSFVAYSYLQGGIRFDRPYFQSIRPLFFKDSSGKKTPITSFGLRPEDDYAYFKLRKQPRIYQGWGEMPTPGEENILPPEFIIDLDRNSQPTQIILAAVAPKATLADTVSYVEKQIASTYVPEDRSGLGTNDALLMPDISYLITHHFKGLEGRKILNPALKGQRLDIAQEDISFRLDRSGAELKAESKQYAAPIATYYIFNRPFLLYLKKRGAKHPYFVMWVDNAELLKPMPGNKSPLTADQRPPGQN